MQVQCPNCSKTLRAPDSAAGKVVKCPACGGQMQLPELGAAAVPAPPAGGAGPAKPTSPGQPPDGAAEGQTKPCPYCREMIQPGAIKCRHCGELLDTRRRLALAEGHRHLKSFRTGMLVLGVLLLVFGGLLVLATIMLGVASSMLAGKGGEEEFGVAFVAIMGTIAAAYLLLGIFACLRHNWVNWVVVAVGGPSIVWDVVAFLAGDITGVIRGAVALGLIGLAVRNIRKRGKAMAAGLDVNEAVGRKMRPRSGRPVARGVSRLRAQARR